MKWFFFLLILLKSHIRQGPGYWNCCEYRQTPRLSVVCIKASEAEMSCDHIWINNDVRQCQQRCEHNSVHVHRSSHCLCLHWSYTKTVRWTEKPKSTWDEYVLKCCFPAHTVNTLIIFKLFQSRSDATVVRWFISILAPLALFSTEED